MDKKCSKCGEERDISVYTTDRSKKDGKGCICKFCRKSVNRKKYLANVEYLKERSRLYREHHPEKVAAVKKSWYLRNAELVRTKSATYYEHNKEHRKLQMKEWYARNKAHKNAKSLAWASLNPGKAAESVQKWSLLNKGKRRATYLTWYGQNSHVRAASSAKRRAAKLLRTPKWLTPTEIVAIAKLYEKAVRISQQSGVPHVVDHELPLQGKFVSGLHVLANLQIITAEENTLKHNKWTPL